MAASRAYRTELLRTIRGSLARFLAIAGIVALGCGFFAGLLMSGPSMRATADRLYDGTYLDDVRVVSTLGLGPSQLDKMAQVQGVEQVSGIRSADAMATINDEQYAVRVSSFDVDAARRSHTNEGGWAVSSDDEAYLDRLVLVEGAWPTRPDECLLAADRKMGTPMKVGDKVEVLYGTADLDGVLEVRTFTVSGLARSSAYVSSTILGYTSLGSGVIQQFLYVPDEAFCADLPYTQALLTVKGARDELSGSEAYQRLVDEVTQRLESLAPQLARDRLADLRADARRELADAEKEYADAKDTADRELADARQQLDDAAAQLSDAQAQLERSAGQLASGRLEYADGQRELASGRAALAQGRAELAQQEQAWEQARSQLVAAQEGLAQIADGLAQLDAGLAQLDEGLAQLDVGLEQAQGGLGQLQQAQAALQAQLDQLDQLGPGQEELKAQLRAQLAALAEQQAALEAQIGELTVQRAQAQAQRDELTAQRTALEEQRAQAEQQVRAAGFEPAGLADQIAATDAQLQDGRERLAQSEAQLAQAARQLEAARAQIASGQQAYDEGLAEYEDGRSEYERGEQEYESNHRKAHRELADAAAQLADARADIDALEEPDLYVLDRTQLVGVASYQADSERIDHIAAVFPLFFFLVAALVALTTMTRMVEEERQEIGCHKALGYGSAQITAKYLVYAGLAGVCGGGLGIALLTQVLPLVIMYAYAIMYSLPIGPPPLPVDAGVVGLALGAGVGICLVATWGAAVATLREAPASLMLPRAPKPGKRILLEYVRPLWSRLSFSWKVTLRNLFLYKRRLLMTVIGIAGCTALLLTGLGLHDSIWDIIAVQFEGSEPIFGYNVVVRMADDATTADRDEVRGLLQSMGGAEGFASVYQENMQAGGPGLKSMGISTMVVSDPAEFAGFVTLRDRLSHERIELGPRSVVLTEKLATTLGVGPGDSFTLYEQDSIGNPLGSGHDLVVDAVTENYVHHYCYLGAQAWEDAMGEPARDNEIVAHVRESSELARTLHDGPAVDMVQFVNETIDAYRTSLRSVNMIVVVLILAAAALAFIVLYNLTNINIHERTREIASLKVLGFTRKEVVSYVFREVALLVLGGAVLGLALGTVLVDFVIRAAEVDAVMFGRSVHLASYLGAYALTLLFAGVVMVAMVPKLRRIDMVESLKSVD